MLRDHAARCAAFYLLVAGDGTAPLRTNPFLPYLLEARPVARHMAAFAAWASQVACLSRTAARMPSSNEVSNHCIPRFLPECCKANPSVTSSGANPSPAITGDVFIAGCRGRTAAAGGARLRLPRADRLPTAGLAVWPLS